MGPPLHCLPCRWWEGGLDRWASGLIQASAAFSACVRAAVDESPGASLILGGFSQGAAVALRSACESGIRVDGLLQLSAQAPANPLSAGSLDGVSLLIAAGDADEIAPIATAEALLEACVSAGAAGAQSSAGAVGTLLFKYQGAHEVTLDVADAVRTFIEEACARAPRACTQ